MSRSSLDKRCNSQEKKLYHLARGRRQGKDDPNILNVIASEPYFNSPSSGAKDIIKNLRGFISKDLGSKRMVKR